MYSVLYTVLVYCTVHYCIILLYIYVQMYILYSYFLREFVVLIE